MSFDFSAVSVAEAEMPKSGAGRPRKTENNPFTEVLAQSYEAFKAGGNAGRQIKVPGANVGEAVYLIRQAADDLKIGSRVLIRDGKGQTVTAKDAKDKAPRAQHTVLFSAKDRKKRAEDALSEAPAETPAEDGTSEG